MKRAVGILSIAVAAVFAGTLAFGQTGYGTGTSGAGTTGGGTAGAGYVGQHTMTGTVKNIDKNAGTVSIEAEGKQLDLHFPQTALQDLSKGDRVSVQLAIRKSESATSGARPGGMGGGMGENPGGMGTGTGGGVR